MPVVSLDYQEFDKDASGEKQDGETPKVKSIVAKDEVTGSVLSYKILRKGPSDEWLMKRLREGPQGVGPPAHHLQD